MHALFNQNAAKNTWTISASALRSFAEYFGAKTEHLDISTENGRTTFMSYTEKLMNGKGLQSSCCHSQENQLINPRCFEAALTDLNHCGQS